MNPFAFLGVQPWRYNSACACLRCEAERERRRLIRAQRQSQERRLEALRTAPAMPALALLYKPAHGGRDARPLVRDFQPPINLHEAACAAPSCPAKRGDSTCARCGSFEHY